MEKSSPSIYRDVHDLANSEFYFNHKFNVVPLFCRYHFCWINHQPQLLQASELRAHYCRHISMFQYLSRVAIAFFRQIPLWFHEIFSTISKKQDEKTELWVIWLFKSDVINVWAPFWNIQATDSSASCLVDSVYLPIYENTTAYIRILLHYLHST